MLLVKDVMVLFNGFSGDYALLKKSPLSLKEFKDFICDVDNMDYEDAINVVEPYLRAKEAMALKTMYRQGIIRAIELEDDMLEHDIDYAMQYYIIEPIMRELGIIFLEDYEVELEFDYLTFSEKVGTL